MGNNYSMSDKNEFDLVMESEMMRIDGQNMATSSLFNLDNDFDDIMDLNFHIDHNDSMVTKHQVLQNNSTSLFWDTQNHLSFKIEPY